MSSSANDIFRDAPWAGRPQSLHGGPDGSGRAERPMLFHPERGGSPDTAAADPILIVDGDPARAGALAAIVDFLGHPAVLAAAHDWQHAAGAPGSAAAVLIAAEDDVAELAGLIEAVLAWDPCVPVCVIDIDGTARRLPPEARDGARFVRVLDYPLRQPDLGRALEQGRIFRENRKPRPNGEPPRLMRALVGASPVMQHVRYLIDKVAPTDATVLVLGETGTGKEIVARNIHYLSRRRGAPFVAVNCGAIPAELLESELFGHEKGAFTGAISARPGRFELAEGGTLFLDEIGDMPLPMQVKLLRVLQEQSFERVGGTRTQRTNVRVIAATHRDMEQLISEGRFREDLFYRLNVFPIETSPLRERIEDLPLLISELIARMEAAGRGSLRLTGGALDALTRYSWPGNVRELSNLLERLAILHPNEVVGANGLPRKFLPQGWRENADESLADMPPPVLAPVAGAATDALRLPPGGMDLRDYLSRQEISLINQALDEAGNVVAQAASLLGMRRTTLVEKMRKYGINRRDALPEF